MNVDEVLAELQGVPTNRRSLLKRAAGAGLVFPSLLAIANQPASATGGIGAATGGAKAAAAPANQLFALYDPMLKPVEPGPKKISLVAKDETVLISKDVTYGAWTFDGTVPGPMLRVREGDPIDFTLSIDPNALTGHSLDFHSAQTPPNVNYRTIVQGESLSWSFTPKYPGAYMYHCGTPPVLMHIGTGMYGAMIVDPKEGWPEAQEIALVQSEFYLKDSDAGVKVADYTKMLGHGAPDLVTFNGYANQYVENPIHVKVGVPIRIFVVNAGPNVWSSFHVVGAIFDKVYVNANPKNVLVGLQSFSIGPGDGACVELTLDEPGSYAAVNHAFGHASQGAIAILEAS